MRMIGPQLAVCSRCREPISNPAMHVRRKGHVYCGDCAEALVLVDGVERDPKKFGGHHYTGPKETAR